MFRFPFRNFSIDIKNLEWHCGAQNRAMFLICHFSRRRSPSSHGQLLLAAGRQAAYKLSKLHDSMCTSSKAMQELVNSLSQITSLALMYIYFGNRCTSVIDAFFMKIDQYFRFVFEVLNIHPSVSKQEVMGLLGFFPFLSNHSLRIEVSIAVVRHSQHQRQYDED